jgi:hypothetical protein
MNLQDWLRLKDQRHQTDVRFDFPYANWVKTKPPHTERTHLAAFEKTFSREESRWLMDYWRITDAQKVPLTWDGAFQVSPPVTRLRISCHRGLLHLRVNLFFDGDEPNRYAPGRWTPSLMLMTSSMPIQFQHEPLMQLSTELKELT